MTGSGTRLLERLGALLDEWPHPTPHHPAALARSLQRLCDAGLDRLPAPGGGQTLQRWQALATVAAQDLSLCKLYEGHTDALAILEHYVAQVPARTTWGMWAAEPPQARVALDAEQRDGSVCLHGRKAWCSGATVLSHGLLTAWNERGEQQLVAGWYGAARRLGEALRSHCAERDEPHALAHLGTVDCALTTAASALQGGGAWIDANPEADAELPVRRVRAIVEHSASTVIEHVGRALGAAPYCRDGGLARLLADLPVFLRQSHAERDLAALGELVARQPHESWML
nr:acyl-CoA dehydrogenase [Pseudomonas sp.]